MPEELPSTIEKAVKYLLDRMPEADKETLKNTAEDDLIRFHFGLGMYIRNQLGLWGTNKKLLDSFSGVYHPDDLSMEIIEAIWKELQRT
jgi:hypothetical protein